MEIALRDKKLAEKQKALNEALERHAAEQEKVETDLLVARQTKDTIEKEKSTIEAARGALEAEVLQAKQKFATVDMERTKLAKELASREQAIAQKQKELDGLLARHAAEQEKSRASTGIVEKRRSSGADYTRASASSVLV